jgi:hypothetical protein
LSAKTSGAPRDHHRTDPQLLQISPICLCTRDDRWPRCAAEYHINLADESAHQSWLFEPEDCGALRAQSPNSLRRSDLTLNQ